MVNSPWIAIIHIDQQSSKMVNDSSVGNPACAITDLWGLDGARVDIRAPILIQPKAVSQKTLEFPLQ